MTIHFGFWILDWVQDDRAYRGFAFLDRDYEAITVVQSKIQNPRNSKSARGILAAKE